MVERIAFHRARARWLPPERRPWTIDPPRGWEAEQTLDAYLDEQDFLRALHQEYERDTPDLREIRGW